MYFLSVPLHFLKVKIVCMAYLRTGKICTLIMSTSQHNKKRLISRAKQ